MGPAFQYDNAEFKMNEKNRRLYYFQTLATLQMW